MADLNKIASNLVKNLVARRTDNLTSKIAHDAMADRVAASYQKYLEAKKNSKK